MYDVRDKSKREREELCVYRSVHSGRREDREMVMQAIPSLLHLSPHLSSSSSSPSHTLSLIIYPSIDTSESGSAMGGEMREYV